MPYTSQSGDGAADGTRVPLDLVQLTEIAPEPSAEQFHGALMDNGAQKSVIGLPQAKAYCEGTDIPFKLSKSGQVFRFGKGSAVAIVKLTRLIPILSNLMPVEVCVIQGAYRSSLALT